MSWKDTNLKNNIANNGIPKHVAIIMDGNGRWARQRDLPRNAGHKAGMEVIRKIAIEATNQKIQILTLFTFSTENWKRPQQEIDFLMKLPKQFLQKYLQELNDHNIRIHTIGEINRLPKGAKEAIIYAREKTKNNNGLILNFAINYGSRFEMMKAIQQIMEDIEHRKLSIDELNEETFSNYLYTYPLADPDLLIRTSGEKRLSNFMLWQLAYTEFWFTDVLWPDFNEKIFLEALNDFKNRKRRFGGIEGAE